jgi:hypothetical protein
MEIKKEIIPNWTYGDVFIKKYSYGEKITMAQLASKAMKDGEIIEGADIQDVSIYMLASGIQMIRGTDNMTEVIGPNTSMIDRRKFAYDMDFDAAVFILNRIKDINQPLGADEKKN